MYHYKSVTKYSVNEVFGPRRPDTFGGEGVSEEKILSILKDIQERKEIIEKYRKCGLLDRNDAINKIISLRISDEEVAVATSFSLSKGRVTFENASNEQIIYELQMQIEILALEMANK